MLKRVCGLVLIAALIISLPGCWITGTERGHHWSESIDENKSDMGPYESHFATHFQVFFDGLNEMHKFWDRHFLNYDWDNPYYN